MKKYYRRKEEAFSRLKQLGVGFIIMVLAIVMANAWVGIAKASGFIPTAATLDDDGYTGDASSTDAAKKGTAIPHAVVGNGIDDSTDQMNWFFTSMTNWVVGVATAALGLLIAFIGFKYATETDPQKKE